jgi:hypothetical protein
MNMTVKTEHVDEDKAKESHPDNREKKLKRKKLTAEDVKKRED